MDVNNDGNAPLTGISATVTPLTAGVTVVDGSATYGDLGLGATGTSLSPHFTVDLSPTLLACGDTLSFQVSINTAQGNFADTFTQTVGLVLPGNGEAINETFGGAFPPTGWTIVDGGSGGGAAATWTNANPGSRSFSLPLTDPVAIVDSDAAASGPTQDEQLITPVMDLSTATSVTLTFDQYFFWYSGGGNEVGDVDVKSSLTGGVWTNVFRNQGASSPDPDSQSIDITAQAAGAADVQVRFYYYNGSYDWYWEVDNVVVSYTAPGGCVANTCTPSATVPPPVPDGGTVAGTPMGAARMVADGSQIDLSWDVSTCTATEYHAVYGPLSGVSTYSLTGAQCGLGITGSYSWTSTPAGDLWFSIVGGDGAGKEGTWGYDDALVHRSGTTSSGSCSATARDNSGTCP